MEKENRKVLISVKVSTLLLILIAVVVAIVLINKIKFNIQKNAELANFTNYEQSEVQEDQQNRVIKVELSSRGTNANEKRHSDIEDTNSEKNYFR